MNPIDRNPFANCPAPDTAPGAVEETLRLIAKLPAPAGLEDRVHAALRIAPRHGRVLAWPTALQPGSAWMRSAAAAAIVFVVAGGGWGVYTHVQNAQHGQPAKVIVMPPRLVPPGGFSGAGAMRTPQTLPGPTVILPVEQKPTHSKGTKKPGARPAPAGAGSSKPAPAAKPAVQPAASK